MWSTSAAAAAGAPSSADDRVYRAVAANQSVEEVKSVIERSPSSAAAVNLAGRDGETPLHAAMRLERCDLICLLIDNGAEGDDDDRFEAGRWCVHENDLPGLRRLVERGVLVNTARDDGYTLFMNACHHARQTADRRDLTLEVFRRSSAETRRAVDSSYGWSAVDYFFYTKNVLLPLQPWHGELVVGLLTAGAPVQQDNAPRAVPIAAAHAARREAELAACQTMGHDWRAQETFAGLSMDMGELREAEQEVLERRARLALLKLAVSSEGDSDSGNDSESESESEEGEATGSGGGGEE